jgi:hypothetical protein
MNSYETIRKEAIHRWDALVHGDVPVIYLGTASCGKAAGAMEVLQSIEQTICELKLNARVVQVGCIGPCYMEPLMDVALPGQPRISYAQVTPEKAKKSSLLAWSMEIFCAGWRKAFWG